MLFLHRLVASKRSRYITLVALFLSCFTLVVLWSVWDLDALQRLSSRLGPQQAFDTHVPPGQSPADQPSAEQPSPGQSSADQSSVSPTDRRPPSKVPKKLWYKLGPKGLNDKTQAWTDTCIQNNKDYEAVFLNDTTADNYVLQTFGESNPDLVDLYLNLTVPIFKADMLRYLLLFTEGGVYCDLDVSCQVPIDDWIPTEYRADASLVVGWEFDGGFGDNILRQFATWTMMAAPRSPHLWAVVEDIVAFFQEKMREHDVPPQGLTREVVGDVVDATGPRRLTRNLLKRFEAFDTTLEDIKRIEEPRLVGDVLVLPGYSFAASMNRYPDMEVIPPPLVKHHYAGTWKNEHGGEVASKRSDVA